MMYFRDLFTFNQILFFFIGETDKEEGEGTSCQHQDEIPVPSEVVDNEADAFRHAYFSFRLADKVGSARAKKFTDAYEISNINTMGARCMDLWNNREGRRMCEESANSKESDRRAQAEKIVLDAVKSKRLILSPFRLQNVK